MQVRNNGLTIAGDPLKKVYTAALANIITEKKVALEAREILPRITNLIGLNISTRKISAIVYRAEGKAIITDLRASTLPVMIAEASKKEWDTKWISIGMRTDVNERDDIAAGITLPVNKTLEHFRVVQETENEFLLNGFKLLGIEGINSKDSGDGIHIVAAGGQWASATGEAIVADIGKLYEALTTGGIYTARTLLMPEKLDFLISQTIYTDKAGTANMNALTIKEVLEKRGYYLNYKRVRGIQAPMLVDDIPENFGFVDIEPLSISETYKNGRADENAIEEKISEFMLLKPLSIAKLTGATA